METSIDRNRARSSHRPRAAVRAALANPISRMLSGSVIGQSAVLLVSPVLTRIYGADGFGGLAVVTSIAGILGGFATLAWERAVVVPPDAASAPNLVRLGFMSVAATSLLVATVFLAGGTWFAAILGWPSLSDYWWVVASTVAAVGCYTVATSWLVREQRYSSLAVRNLAQGLSQATCGVLLGLVGWIPAGLLVSLGVGRVAGLVGIGIGRERADNNRPLPPLGETARRFRRFPLITSWSGLANSIGLQLPLLLMAGIYGVAQLGLFALTIRVVASPVGLVVDAAAQFFEGRFALRTRGQDRQLWRLMRSTVVWLLAAGALPAASLGLAGPALFKWLFGAEWEASGVFAQVLALTYLAQFVVVPVSRALTVLELQGRQLAWDVGRAIATCGGVTLAAMRGGSLLAAVFVFGMTQLVFYVVMFAMCRHAAKQADEAGDQSGT